MLICGLDPGTVRTGFAVVRLENEKFSILDFGVLSAPPRQALEERFFTMGKNLEKLYGQYPIKETAIEKIFLGKNPDIAFKLGQVFGLCAYQAFCSSSQVFSYATRYIKQSVTGSGNADKKAVGDFVLNIFGIKKEGKKIADDATDALAVALCHVYQKSNPLSALAGGVSMGGSK